MRGVIISMLRWRRVRNGYVCGINPLCVIIALIVAIPSQATSAGRHQTPQPGPYAGLDLETVFLGYSNAAAGSSIQLDLRMASGLIRLTAWTQTPAQRFNDYQIDIPVSPATVWKYAGANNTGSLHFEYQNPLQNLQVKGDMLLSPQWRGVVVTAPIDPTQPMANVPTKGPISWLLERAPLVADAHASGGMRSMPFGVFKTVQPSISIPVDLVTGSNGRVYLDDGWDATADSVDITAQFHPVGGEAVAHNLPFRYGTNRLTFVLPHGTFEVYCMNYDANTPGLVEEEAVLAANDYLNAHEGASSEAVLDNGVGFFVLDTQAEADTSSFLRVYRLRPIGYASFFHRYEALVYGTNLSGDRDNNGVTDLIDYANGAPAADPRAQLFNAEETIQEDTVGETIPAANANNNATFGYNLDTHGWNDPAGVSGLDLLREHFWMDTFAAHGLTRAFSVTGAPAYSPTVGVFDSGLGFGNAFPDADLPVDAFRDIWVIPGQNTARPTRVNTMANMRVAVDAGALMDPLTTDDLYLASSHGTKVAHFVGGRGGRFKLGIGKDALVTVYKLVGFDLGTIAFNSVLALMSVAANDPVVRVINFSNGALMPAVLGTDTPAQAAAKMEFSRKTTLSAEYVYDKLSTEGIVSVLAAGNSKDPRLLAYPGTIAPARGSRDTTLDNYSLAPGGPGPDGMSSLVVRVGAVTVPSGPLAGEQIWFPAGVSGTGVGDNISVVAAGDNVASVDAMAMPARGLVGTSYAAPLVSGLLGEVTRILDLKDRVADPPSLAARRGRRAKALRAIEIVEATADGLGRDIPGTFKAGEPGADDMQGYGRVNAWRAILSAINGGVSEGGTSKGVAPYQFGAVDLIDAAHTSMYGFLVREQSNDLNQARRFNNATVWINKTPYTNVFGPVAKNLAGQLGDAGANTGFTGADGGAAHNFVAYKRVGGLNSRLPTGFTIGVGDPGTGLQEMVFSAGRNELVKAGDPIWRLELRRNGDDATAQPFYSAPIDLATLRNNAANGTNVRFKDFVFEILVDHSVDVAPNEAVVGAGDGALPMADEVPLRVTVRDLANAGVAALPVKFTVVDTKGVQSAVKQIRLRTMRGAGVPATTQTVNTDAGGVATVFVTRIAAGAKGADPQGVLSRILIDLTVNSGGGAAAGMQYPQQFTVPTH